MKSYIYVLALIGVLSKIEAEPDKPATVYISFEEAQIDSDDDDVHGIALYDLTNDGSYNRRKDFISVSFWPYYFIMDKSGKRLYTIEQSDITGNYFNLTAYVRDQDSGKFLLKTTSDTGTNMFSLALDDTDKYLVTADFATGSVKLNSLNEDGTFEQIDTFNVTKTENVNMTYPMKVGFSNFQKDLVGVAFAGMDKVSFFQLDANHKLQKTEIEAVTAPGSFPANFIFSNNSQVLYVLSLKSATVTVFDVKLNLETSKIEGFSKAQELRSLPDGISGATKRWGSFIEEGGDARIQIHPNGKFLYTMHCDKQFIGVFKIDEKGRLSFIEFQDIEGFGSFGMVIAPDGEQMIVTNGRSDMIIVFDINEFDGKLIPTYPTLTLGEAGFIMYPGS